MMVKSRRQAGGGAELPEQAMPDGVEGPAVRRRAPADPTRRSARDSISLGGAAREGEEQDALGRDAPLDELRDAVDERARLAGAGAGDDEERTVAERGGPRLIVVQ